MHNYKGFAAIVLFILFCSCHNLDGKIETRQGDKIYLVNNSQTKQISFTVKQTVIKNDSIFDYDTRVIPLVPGGELYLGQKDSRYKIAPEYDLSVFDNAVKNKDYNIDTIVAVKQPDTIVKYQYKYEVTGQSEAKPKPEKQ